MRTVLLSASGTLAVCLGYAGAGAIIELMRGETEKPAPVSSFEDSKTDFISVAVFDGGKVSGYFSFRVAFSISDAARALEVQRHLNPQEAFGIPNQLKPSGTVEGIRARNQKPDRKQATSQLGGERACHRLCIRCAHLSGN